MKRRFLSVSISLLLSFLAVAPAVVRAVEDGPPHIVLLLCDDLGWGDVGFNGNDAIRTPHLDEMAAGSLRLTRFYAAAPVCSPTRGSCLTGRHPYRYGIHYANDGHLRARERTLAEILGERGYATGHFGKWHLGTLTRTVRDSNRGGPRGVAHYSPPWRNGFDVCFSTEAKVPTWDPMMKPASGASARGWKAIRDASKAVPYGTFYWNERGERVTENLRGDDSRIIVDRVLPFIDAALENDRPFFAVVWFHTPHLPVVAGPEYASLYAEYETYRQNYYGCITAMDEQVGRLRRFLRERDAARNALIFLASDNGPEGNDKAPGSAGPFRGRKRSLLEGGIRVPALVEWPARVEGGRSSDLPASTSDYLPTILDVLELERPASRPLDGISLLPLLEGGMDRRSSPIAFESRKQLALIDDRFKLYSSNAGESFALYDLLADPGETTDVAAAHPEVVARMRASLDAWRNSCQQSAEALEE